MVRETPRHAGHLRVTARVTDAGGNIFPTVPAWYALPVSTENSIAHGGARALSLLDLDCNGLPRWGDLPRQDTRGGSL